MSQIRMFGLVAAAVVLSLCAAPLRAQPVDGVGDDIGAMGEAMEAVAPAVDAAQRAAALNDALNALPANAHIAIIIPSAAEASRKALMLSEALTLPLPIMGDPLQEMKRELGINQGMDDNGPVVIYFDLAADLAGWNPPVVMLMPATDYAAFVGNFQGNPDADVTELVMPGGGFARKVGRFAAMSPHRELVEQLVPANNAKGVLGRLEARTAKALAGNDVSVMMDFAALRPMMEGPLEEMLADAERELNREREFDDMPPALRKYIVPLFSLFRDVSRAFVAESELATAGLSASELGLALNSSAHFKGDGSFAKFLAGPGRDTDLFKALPAEGYIMAASNDARAIRFDLLFAKLRELFPAAEFAELTKMIDSVEGLVKTNDHTVMGYYMPAGAPELGVPPQIKTLGVTKATDPKAYLAAMQRMIAALNELKLDIPDPDADPDAGEVMTFKIDSAYTPAQREIEGVAVDMYKIDVVLPDRLQEQMQFMMDAGDMAMLNAALHQTGLLANVDGHVLVVDQDNEALLGSAIRALRAGDGLGANEAVAQMRDTFDKGGTGEILFDLASMMKFVDHTFQAQGMGGLMMMEGDPIPPIAARYFVDKGHVTKQVMMPMPTLAYTINSGRQIMGMIMMMQMQQHQQWEDDWEDQQWEDDDFEDDPDAF